MKQIQHNIKSGQIELVDVPRPYCSPGHVLIATHTSLISVGTERMLVDFGKAGWISKARQQPEKVKQVLDKVRADGLLPTIDTVLNKLDEPLPLGYCNAGVVLEIGIGVSEIQIGDRVASNGPHSEVVCVPRNLCSKIPEGVTNEEAAFTVLGSIALQGVRLAHPSLGERFIVFGLGLVGLLTVQFLRASGCHVLAVDISKSRLRMAEAFGAETVDLGLGMDPIAAALTWSFGKGVDGVIITASAKGDDIIHQSAQSCRKRGRIILVGVVNLNLRRSDFYEKEITFQVSCSYGPGRYDLKYEQCGLDYPFGFVRWTEQRNFEAVLEAMRIGQLQVKELITNHIPFEESSCAYEKILSNSDTLGVILEYQNQLDLKPIINFKSSESRPAGGCGIALIGAGNFSKMILAPALAKTSARLKYVSVRSNGSSATYIARKYRFEKASTDLDTILADEEVNTVFIATNHNSHAKIVVAALNAGKHVFVEKPLCLNLEELNEIISVYSSLPTPHSLRPLLMVGFNRRFSPHVQKMMSLLAGRSEPLAMSMMINAGIIPSDSWVHDPEKGGGRIIGEACHFIDLMVYITGFKVVSVSALQMGGRMPIRQDKMSIQLSFEDGSIGTVNYFSNGNKAYPKETFEVYSDGRILKLDNFRRVGGYGFQGFRNFKTWQMNKGHRTEVADFIALVEKGGKPLIPFSDIVNVTLTSFAAVTSAREGRRVFLEKEYGELSIQ